ncbi:MAG: outer membrane beta-barrel protein [Acidobacteriota bacterium]|jgi:hypothetical protein|nr:outer membrane beta-barrel protein [Acidobacteriota bacterium]
MKAILGILIISLTALTPGLAAAETAPVFGDGDFSLAVGAGMRSLTEDIAESLYGKNNLVYSLDLAYALGKSLDIFVHTDYLQVDGETTFTKENTSLSIIPIEAGLRLRLSGRRLEPQIGFGAGYYMIKDEIEIASETFTLEKNQVGFFIEGGLRVYVTRALFVFAQGRMTFLKFKPDQSTDEDDTGIIYYNERDLGGFAILGGLGIRF